MNTTVQTLPQTLDYIRLLPEIVLSLFGVLIMLLDPIWVEPKARRGLGIVALAGAVMIPKITP